MTFQGFCRPEARSVSDAPPPRPLGRSASGYEPQHDPSGGVGVSSGSPSAAATDVGLGLGDVKHRTGGNCMQAAPARSPGSPGAEAGVSPWAVSGANPRPGFHRRPSGPSRSTGPAGQARQCRCPNRLAHPFVSLPASPSSLSRPGPAEQAVIARTTAQHISAGVTDQSILEATGAASNRIVAATAE